MVDDIGIGEKRENDVQVSYRDLSWVGCQVKGEYCMIGGYDDECGLEAIGGDQVVEDNLW